MPVYEFACKACGAAVSVFVRTVSSPVEGTCQRCGGTDLRRLISKFSFRSSSGGADNFDDPNYLPDPSDPKALARWARHMRQEMGEDTGDYDLEEQIERLEHGETMNEDRLEDLASYTGTHLDDD